MMNLECRVKHVLALTAVFATVAATAFAQAGPTPARQAGQAPAQGGAVQQLPTVDRYVVGQAQPPAEPGLNRMDLSLDTAMQIALENNLDLRAARMSPQAVDYQLTGARAAFNPRITSSYAYNNAQTANNSTLEGSANVSNLSQRFNGGVSQLMPWYGGTVTASFNNTRSTTNSTTSLFNPNYQSNLSVNYTQPLLAGFKIDNTRNQLRTLAVTRQVADLTLLSTIENTKANVRTAYWNLRQAIEQIEIQRRALDLARRLFEDNRVKVEIGTLAPIDTVQPEAQVATAEQGLLNAEITWKTAQLSLKRLLANGPDDDIYRATINPTETPALSISSVDIEGAVARATAERTDVLTSRKNIESAQLTLEVTRNQTKPQLDLTGGYSVAGQGGSKLFQGNRLPGGVGDAFGQVFGLDYPNWNFGFNFTYPLGMAQAKANYARAVLLLEQQEAQLKATELTISSDVTNAGLAVENTYKQFQAAVKNREAQERNTDAAQTRFDVGMSTNYEVVQAQNNLTASRLTELSRLIAYLNAIAEFDRIQRVGR